MLPPLKHVFEEFQALLAPVGFRANFTCFLNQTSLERWIASGNYFSINGFSFPAATDRSYSCHSSRFAVGNSHAVADQLAVGLPIQTGLAGFRFARQTVLIINDRASPDENLA